MIFAIILVVFVAAVGWYTMLWGDDNDNDKF